MSVAPVDKPKKLVYAGWTRGGRKEPPELTVEFRDIQATPE